VVSIIIAALIAAAYVGIGTLLWRLLGNVSIAGYKINTSIFTSAIIGLGIIFWYKRRSLNLNTLGLFRPRRWWISALTGILGAVVIYGIIIVIVSSLVSLGLMEMPEDQEISIVSGESKTLSLILVLIIVWINAAFFEELIFRGFLLQKVADSIGTGAVAGVAGAALSSLIFGAMHYFSQGMYGVIITGLTGFLIGIMFLLTRKNLAAVVITHGLINTVGIVGAYLSGA
jgi:membrane protease YdiL (CAAX protease family)